MAVVSNFDTLNALRTEAARCGVGGKAWIEFATVMFDSFPALYQTAKNINVIVTRANLVEDALRNLIAQIELHVDCMTGLIEADALDDWIDEAEKALFTSGFWRSVDEGLPDADTTVLVCTEDCAEPVWLGYFDGCVWRDIDSMPIKVSHWGDLPVSATAALGRPS